MQPTRRTRAAGSMLLALAMTNLIACSSPSPTKSEATISTGLNSLSDTPQQGDAQSVERFRSDLDKLTSDPTIPKTPEQVASAIAAQAKRQSEYNRQPRTLTPVSLDADQRINRFEPPESIGDLSVGSTQAAKPATSSPVPAGQNPPSSAASTPTPVAPVDTSLAAAAAEAAWSNALATPSMSVMNSNAGGASKTLDQQTVELAASIAGLLREPGTPEHPRMSDAAAIAAIQSLRPGSIAELEQPTSFLGSALSAVDRQTLVESRDRLVQQGAPALADLQKHIKGISPGPVLTIARAALCTKVSGFGNFAPYPTNVFRVGTTIRAIIYIELENFITRPARDGDRIAKDTPVDQQVSVDVSQSVSIFQEAGGMLAWHSPPRPIIDTSRSARRDFYLIQQIELPRTLSIGRYNLKVQIKDLGNNSEAETVIPISIVAQ
ncbi:MAG: hypothetical protein NTV94_08745 [Planctomycetota bacterium]|nr:hypothetical protein [Planctomycetota bacterium]